MTITTLAHDLEEIRVAADELPELAPEQRAELVGRIARYARAASPATEDFLAEATVLRERAGALERCDPEDVERLQSLLLDLHGLLAATAAPLGEGYDGPVLEHEP